MNSLANAAYSTTPRPTPTADPPRTRTFGQAQAQGQQSLSPSNDSSTTTSSSSSKRHSTLAIPAPRSFGGSTSASAHSSLSNTPTNSNLHLPLNSTSNAGGLPPKLSNRTRSSSSASLNAANLGDISFQSAADKASAWLSNWAPRGEGRSIQYLGQALNGVASVASTVSSGINERVSNLGLGAQLGQTGALAGQISGPNSPSQENWNGGSLGVAPNRVGPPGGVGGNGSRAASYNGTGIVGVNEYPYGQGQEGNGSLNMTVNGLPPGQAFSPPDERFRRLSVSPNQTFLGQGMKRSGSSPGMNNSSNSNSNNNNNLNFNPSTAAGPPPGPTHVASTNAIPPAANVRRVPQPANLSRLGTTSVSGNSGPGGEASNATGSGASSLGSSSTRPPAISAPATSNPLPNIPRSTSSTSNHSLTSTATGLLPGPHGPSSLNPSHTRTASSQTTNSHLRSSSYGGGGPSALSSSTTIGNTRAGTKSPTPSRSSSTTAGNTGIASNLRSAGMPYKLGFQPAGVKFERTHEYLEARRRACEDREKEEGRLGRRWAKLVDLHFNPIIPISGVFGAAGGMTGTGGGPPGLTRSSSSSFSLSGQLDKRKSLLSMDTLEGFKAKEMWKGIKGVAQTPEQTAESKKRAAEQALVKWEDDSEVKKCRICQASFNLSNRKHHCRLCGRIVCSLPPTPPALLAVQIQLFSPVPDPPGTPSISGNGLTLGGGGDVILPPGTRREKCSVLLVADWKTGRGEEVEEGFVGWMKLQDGSTEGSQISGDGGSVSGTPKKGNQGANVTPNKKDRRKSKGGDSFVNGGGVNSSPAGSSIGSPRPGGSGNGSGSGEKDQQVQVQSQTPTREIPLPQQPKEVQVKGIRVCRECWATVSRKQKIQDRTRVSGFSRLYSMLRSLQAEIEEVMPDFEEQMDILTSSQEPLDPTPETLETHKTLLTLLAQYEHLSKRLGSLPCPEPSNQATVQSAVARVAANFLTTQTVKIQALPKLQKAMTRKQRRGLRVAEMKGLSAGNAAVDVQEEEADEGDGNGDVAMMLQPLLEQEAQLEVYIADANAQRKYEDGKALSEALNDIRSEIARITQRATR